MKLKISVTLLIILTLCSAIIYAQKPVYSTKVIDGTEYYIYQVEAGEGLYSISKKFGVSQADINNANPQIHDGIKAGQEILIPKTGKQIQPETNNSNDKDGFILHTVEKKQTLFAISRKYDVSQEDIREANPQIANGLKTGDVLRIPVKRKNPDLPAKPQVEKESKPAADKSQKAVEATPAKTVPVPATLHIGTNETYFIHRVEIKETLYSISKIYNVSVDDIVRLNPESATTLKTGTELKIPYNTRTTVNGNGEVKLKPVTEKTSYKIAYLLPFMLDGEKQDPTVEKFLEFYMGSLLAINNAKSGNFKIDVYTYDTEKSEVKINEVLNKPEMQTMDLIIGPAYTAQIPVLIDFSNRRKIPTVIPFSSSIKNIETNPYVFQFNPDNDIHNDYAAAVLKNKFSDANIVFAQTGNTKWSEDGTDFFRFLQKKLDKLNVSYTKIAADILSVNTIETNLSTAKRNVIVFDTEDLSSVQTYLNKLYELSSSNDVSVLGQYSWRGKSGKKPKMYYIAPFDHNDASPEKIQYENDYRLFYKQFRSEKNPRFDMLGYDITNGFIKQMTSNGFRFNETTSSVKFDQGIQSDYNFKRTRDGGGFINQQLYLIEDAPKRK